MIPLADDQPRLQRASVSDEHLVKTILGGHLREAQLFTLEEGAVCRVMPRSNLVELVSGKVGDPELVLQLRCTKTIIEVITKRGLTMIAKAVVTIKVIDHEPIQPMADAVPNPGLKHRPPMGIIQAGPVFLHASDGVAVVPDR